MSPREMGRREFLKKTALGGASLMALDLIACAPAAPAPTPTPTPKPGPTPTPESPEARLSRLYEAAKREGKLMMYSTGTAKEQDDYKTPFQKKYPGIEYEYFTGVSEDIVNRITAEARAGKTIADMVVMTLGGGWGALLKEGLIMKYQSPELRFYPKGTYDPEGYYVHEQYSVYVMCYNTTQVPAAEAPRSYEDLINPKWKGKMAIEVEAYEWFVYMLKLMGREKGIEFMKKLAPLVQLRKGHSTLVELVIAGEFAISPTTYQHRVQQGMDQGAPIRWVANKPTFVFPRSAGIMKNAPHPNAAQLLTDWRLSEEGQQISVKQNRIPTRQGVKANPPSLQEGVEYYPPDPSIDELVMKEQKLFQEIFGGL